MDLQDTQLPPAKHAAVARFVEACQADQGVVAAFLRGSYAAGTADQFSDIDLSLVTTDDAYEEFLAELHRFARSLGQPPFVESFGLSHIVFFIYSDGTECELTVGRESSFGHIARGPYRVLLDRRGILEGVTFPELDVPLIEQTETLRRIVYWFWHDLSHLTTALARGQLWWAHGQLDELRLLCVNLTRLRHDFSAQAHGYEKVELATPGDELSPLETTLCPLERGAMLEAGLAMLRFFREVAPQMAQTQGIDYPHSP